MRSLCPRVPAGQIPFGLSCSDSRDRGTIYRLQLPVLPWFGRHYRINADDYVRGWALFILGIYVEVDGRPGFALHVRYGSSLLRGKHSTEHPL